MAASESGSSSSRYAFIYFDPNHHLEELKSISAQNPFALIWEKSQEVQGMVRSDCRCELLTKRDKVVGLIQYGRECVNLDEKVNSFPLLSFCLKNPIKDAGCGYRTKLLDRIVILANRQKASGIHIDLSSKERAMVEFFEANSFGRIKSFYVGEEERFLLHRNLEMRREKRGREREREDEQTEATSSSLKRHDSQKGRTDPPAPSLISSSISGSSSLPHFQPDVASTPASCPSSSSSSYSTPPPPPLLTRQPIPIPMPFSSSIGSSSSSDTLHRPTRQPIPIATPFSSASSSSSPTATSHEITLKKEYIHQIRNGLKTIEGRINHGMATKWKIGDQIRFFYHHNPYDDVRCEVVGIRAYAGFREMLVSEGFKKCLAEVSGLEAAVAVYNAIPGYNDRARRSGVLAIEIRVIP